MGYHVFPGLRIASENNLTVICQKRYTKKLQSISQETNFTIQSRPDRAFDVAILLQVTGKQYFQQPKHFVKALLKILKYFRNCTEIDILYPNPDTCFLSPRDYSDASFAKNVGTPL